MDISMRLEFWHLVLMMIAFFTLVGSFGQLLLSQIDKRLDERFAAQEEARKTGQEAWRKEFDLHLQAERRETDALIQLEKDFLKFQGELPRQYVLRDDFLRNQTIIESKLDGLGLRIENLQLKGKA